ncbi:hypothetical protein [Nioella nitratireducens]|nr:hypothetical protein [Nioella nitratireducens]
MSVSDEDLAEAAALSRLRAVGLTNGPANLPEGLSPLVRQLCAYCWIVSI